MRREYAVKVYICLLSLMVLSSGAIAGAIIKDGTLQAHSDGNNVTIQWGTTEEVSLSEFVVERQAGSEGGFILIGMVAPKGNNSFYEFVDQTAFKTIATVYQYRIKIVSQDGSYTYSKTVTVSHNVSSVKRTWGSLKAMFR
jgi:hypothetical protein